MIRQLCIVFIIAAAYPLAALSQNAQFASDSQNRINLCRNLLRESLAEMDSGNVDRSLVLLDSVFLCDPANPDAFYYKSIILGFRADTASVMALLATGIEKAPMSTRLKTLLARYLINRNSYEQAWNQIDKVLAVKPHDGEALFLKGLIMEARNDTSAAIQSYQKAIELYMSRGK